jgi:hypothetical protein
MSDEITTLATGQMFARAKAVVKRAFRKRLIDLIYARRQVRHDHPEGKFDNARRWYPSAQESQGTLQVRGPSRSWPYSYLLHCRTRKHCSKLVDAWLVGAAVPPSVEKAATEVVAEFQDKLQQEIAAAS